MAGRRAKRHFALRPAEKRAQKRVPHARGKAQFLGACPKLTAAELILCTPPAPYTTLERTRESTKHDKQPRLPEFYHPQGFQHGENDVLENAKEPVIQRKKKSSSQDVYPCQAYSTMEPPLQRKKRIQSFNPATLPDEYMLLGNQSKFSNNIRYKPKFTGVSKSLEIDVEPEIPVQTPDAPRPNPPPKVVVDTGAPAPIQPKVQSTPTKKSKGVGTENGVIQETKVKEKVDHSKPKVQSSKSDSHVVKMPAPAISKGQPEKTKSDHRVHVPRKQSQAPKTTMAAHSKQASPQVTESKMSEKREKRKGRLNEGVQTNLDRGVAYSSQEAGPNYAMKYQAGIAPPRSKSKRTSEYQMQYGWKKGTQNSPLLDAEQVIYKSDSQMAPYKSETALAKTTEYQRQYKPWLLMKSMPEAPLKEDKSSGSGKRKMKRSKSVEGLSPDRLQPAGVTGGKSAVEFDKRLLAESMNPLRLHFPHGRLKTYKSEYASNFMSPAEFEYASGAWKGAPPPHLHSQKAEQPTPEPEENPEVSSANSWFSEVRELRERAEEYKRRSRGTHFSREHLVQLLARQTEMWDTVSTSSALSALSLEQATPAKVSKSAQTLKDKVPAKEHGKPARKTAWSENGDSISNVAVASEANGFGGSEASFPTARTNQTTSTLINTENGLVPSGGLLVKQSHGVKGRIPTPELAGHGVRHHLDLTTPVSGGVLLPSPVPGTVTPDEESEVLGDECYEPGAVQSEPPAALKARSSKTAIKGRRSKGPIESQSAPAVVMGNSPQVCCTCQPNIPTTSKTKAADPVVTKAEAVSKPDHKSRKTKPLEYVSIPSGGFGFRKPEMVSDKTSKHDSYMKGRHVERNGVTDEVIEEDLEDVSPTYDSQQMVDAFEELGQMQEEYLKTGVVLDKKRGSGQSKRPPTQDMNHVPDIKQADVEIMHDPYLKQRAESREASEKIMPPGPVRDSQGSRFAYGMPSRDTHVLVDEEASTDRPLQTKYVHSPVQSKAGRTDARERFGVAVPSTINENTSTKNLHTTHTNGSMYEVKLDDIPPRPEFDDDIISLSNRSIASSCSMASEVLDRARQRRDEFWGKPDGLRTLQQR